MFSPTSRYANLPTATWTDASGVPVVYVRRRFLPRSQDLPLLVEVTITQGDRLDLIASRTIGDPEQFWRICDASQALNPVDLVDPIGRTVRVPIPQLS